MRLFRIPECSQIADLFASSRLLAAVLRYSKDLHTLDVNVAPHWYTEHGFDNSVHMLQQLQSDRKLDLQKLCLALPMLDNTIVGGRCIVRWETLTDVRLSAWDMDDLLKALTTALNTGRLQIGLTTLHLTQLDPQGSSDIASRFVSR